MGNNLNRSAEKIAPALFVDNGLKHLAHSDIGGVVHLLVDKTLVVTEVEVGFGSVGRYEHLAVLIGAHCARVHIDIGVEFLHKHLVSVSLQQKGDARRRNTFSQTGNHASGNKYIFCHCDYFCLKLYGKITNCNTNHKYAKD